MEKRSHRDAPWCLRYFSLMNWNHTNVQVTKRGHRGVWKGSLIQPKGYLILLFCDVCNVGINTFDFIGIKKNLLLLGRGRSAPAWKTKGCQMYDEVKSHYFIMLLFHSHKQKLASAAVLGFATILCYVRFYAYFEYAWQSCSGQICPPPNTT